MEKRKAIGLLAKTAIFSVIGVIFLMLTPNAGLNTYFILIGAAALWAVYETAQKKKRPLMKNAILMGLFLMAFDFIFENIGAFAGLWTSPNSIFSVITVPIEIMLLTTIGGYAWALHLPQKFDKKYTIFESLIFGFFGALGEYLLILNGMMVYTGFWNSIYAFISYAVVWLILQWTWYKIIKKA